MAPKLDAALRALAHPTRREILWHMWDKELSVGEVTSQFNVAAPTISEHLKVLREANLVIRTIAGTTHRYRADTSGIEAIGAYLSAFQPDRPRSAVNARDEHARPTARSAPVWQTVLEIELDAPPSEAYRYWTNPGHMARWLFTGFEIDPTPGGLFRMRTDAEAEIRARFRHLVPGELLSFTWTSTIDNVPLPPGHHDVTIWFRPTTNGARTVLELRQLSPNADHLSTYGELWTEMLARLIEVIAGSATEPEAL